MSTAGRSASCPVHASCDGWSDGIVRIGVGGVFQETSTYAAVVRGTTGVDAFDVRRGNDLFDVNDGIATEVGGVLRAAPLLGVDLVPLVLAIASPGPTLDAKVYRALRDELVAMVATTPDLDGLLLVLHGAGVAEGVDSIEIDLVTHLRATVGELPIVATLDLHANLGERWAELVDASLPCRLYPHTDLDVRAEEALAVLARLIRSRVRPVTAIVPVPVLCTNGCTDGGLMAESVEWCRSELAADPSLLDVSLLHGFPYTDAPDAGMHVIVTRIDGDERAADALAARLAARLWDRRSELVAAALSAEEAVAAALRMAERSDRPVVINETSDNPGGGAPGDGTHVLRALLAARAEGACFACIADADTAAAAHAAGEGARIDVALGGHRGGLQGGPVHTTALVRCLTDGSWVAEGPIATGATFSLGPSALLSIDGVDVVVASRAEQTWDPAVFRIHGVHPEQRRIVVVKSSTHFRAAFEPMAAAVVTADAPGLTALDVSCLPRERHRLPLYPLDAAAVLAPSALQPSPPSSESRG